MIQLKEKKLQTQNGSIYYFLDDSFAGRPFVVLLHGLSSNHTTWLKVMEDLHLRGFNSLAPDMRAHGFSDKTKNKSLYTIEAFSDDLKKIAEQENIGKFFLVGYSFGGSVAMHFATKHSQDLLGLVLISANFTSPLKFKKFNPFVPLLSFGLDFLSFALRWQKRKKYVYFEHGKSKNYLSSVWTGINTMPLSVNLWLVRQGLLMNMENRLQKIKCPTLIIKAKNDPFLRKKHAHKMLELVEQSKIVIPKNTSHFLATRAQEEISGIILNFLSKH
jgi:3-oxoadipate enol-lactonase